MLLLLYGPRDEFPWQPKVSFLPFHFFFFGDFTWEISPKSRDPNSEKQPRGGEPTGLKSYNRGEAEREARFPGFYSCTLTTKKLNFLELILAQADSCITAS